MIFRAFIWKKRRSAVLDKLTQYIEKQLSSPIQPPFTTESLKEVIQHPCITENELRAESTCAPLEVTSHTMQLPVEAVRELEKNLKNITPFSELLFEYIDKSKFKTDAAFYKKAGIDRRHFAKMKNAGYFPSKQTVYMAALALELHYCDAVNLLEAAGFAFSRSNKADIIMEYCFKEGIYDLFAVNDCLYYFGEKALGVIA